MYHYEKPDNLVEMIEDSIRRFAGQPMFGTPDAEGEYTWTTYEEVGGRIDALRSGLSRLGIGAGDAVGVIVNNCVEWAITAFATFGLGARFIPMYPNELVQIWQHIIKDAGIKVLLAANCDVFHRVQEFRDKVPDLQHLIVIQGTGDDTMAELEAKGRKDPIPSIRPKPEDIAVLIYTSGTTGAPKGVLLSHANFTSNVIAARALFPNLESDSRSLSILPWAHSYGQTAELYTFTSVGASIGFMRDVTTMAEDMPKVAPTFLIAVPRVFNKIYDGLWAKINSAGGLARKLFVMGLNAADQRRTYEKQGRSSLRASMKYKLADAIVFKKIRQRFGGRLQASLTASAMMNLKVQQFFNDIGLPVYDCYGLTETSPAVIMSSPQINRPGSVGKPIDKVRVEIDHSVSPNGAEDGEVVVFGPNVMQGYHNNPEATRKVMTEDGGFRTGDLGHRDEEGFLFITGRIKEQYKLENGKYVFPVSLEEEIQLAPWVENALIYGEGRHYNICIVVPDMVQLASWARERGLSDAPQELVAHPEVQRLIETTIQEHLKGKFGGYEIPKKFIIVNEPFSVDNGMLTQTLKLKRRKVIECYIEKIEAAYAA